jgi:L-fucose isomerase-like protein
LELTVNVGVVCLARQTFDYSEALLKYRQIQRELQKISGVNFIFIPDLIFEREEARAAAARLVQEDLDGLVFISGTFHLGSLVLEMVSRLKKPVLLWGLSEPPYDGGKIRFNAICGVNLDASNLYKAGVRDYHACFGDTIDEPWLAALRAGAVLGRARVGLAGSRAHTFYNLGFDELNSWRCTGALVDYYQLQELIDWPVSVDEEQDQYKQFGETFHLAAVTENQLRLTARMAVKLERFMEHYKLDALALRCWPEFADLYGIAPCAAMSLLQSRGRIIACEGDVEGALSMLVHRALGVETPFLADLSQVDFAADEALLWHCGAAPCNLWDGRCELSLDSYHAGGKGVTADFVLRPGALSLLRVDSAGREIRLFYQEGEALPMDKKLKGTYARVKFPEGVAAVLNRVIEHGIAHHVSAAYGLYRRPLETLARLKGWPFITNNYTGPGPGTYSVNVRG